jgi:hypothetical protein
MNTNDYIYEISKLKAENELLKLQLSESNNIRKDAILKVDELYQELKHVHNLIKEWIHALHHDEEPYNGKVYLTAQNNLRKVVE